MPSLNEFSCLFEKLIHKPIHGDVYKTYICGLADICPIIGRNENKFKIYSVALKKWISEYSLIFSKTRVTQNVIQTINECHSIATKTYLTLSRIFYKYDKGYLQRFYYEWRLGISLMYAEIRAKSFQEHFSMFEDCVCEHLRKAPNRCEQLVILRLLRLYTHNVSKDCQQIEDKKFFIFVIDHIIDLDQKPAMKDENNLLNVINGKNNFILSFQPIMIISTITFCDSEFELCLDFNTSNNSVVFTVVSLNKTADSWISMVSKPSIVHDRLVQTPVLNITGHWSMTSKSSEKHFGKTTFSFHFTPEVLYKILNSNVTKAFSIKARNDLSLPKTSATSSQSQDISVMSCRNILSKEFLKSLSTQSFDNQSKSVKNDINSTLLPSIEDDAIKKTTDSQEIQYGEIRPFTPATVKSLKIDTSPDCMKVNLVNGTNEIENTSMPTMPKLIALEKCPESIESYLKVNDKLTEVPFLPPKRKRNQNQKKNKLQKTMVDPCIKQGDAENVSANFALLSSRETPTSSYTQKFPKTIEEINETVHVDSNDKNQTSISGRVKRTKPINDGETIGPPRKRGRPRKNQIPETKKIVVLEDVVIKARRLSTVVVTPSFKNYQSSNHSSEDSLKNLTTEIKAKLSNQNNSTSTSIVDVYDYSTNLNVLWAHNNNVDCHNILSKNKQYSCDQNIPLPETTNNDINGTIGKMKENSENSTKFYDKKRTAEDHVSVHNGNSIENQENYTDYRHFDAVHNENVNIFGTKKPLMEVKQNYPKACTDVATPTFTYNNQNVSTEPAINSEFRNTFMMEIKGDVQNCYKKLDSYAKAADALVTQLEEESQFNVRIFELMKDISTNINQIQEEQHRKSLISYHRMQNAKKNLKQMQKEQTHLGILQSRIKSILK